MVNQHETTIFGGGCFWCIEAVFSQIKGVMSVVPGYAGGHTQNPTYEQICSGDTGHAEVIRIEFDPSVVAYQKLLEIFFDAHDPTTPNRQGNDTGSQYRSVVLTQSDEQKQIAEEYVKNLTPSYTQPIVTQIRPLDIFYEAEEYHHNYFEKNPDKAYCQIVVAPKVKKAQEHYAELLK